MTPEVAQLTAQFLQRVSLQPSEIEAFQAVMAALGALVNPLEEQKEVHDGRSAG